MKLAVEGEGDKTRIIIYGKGEEAKDFRVRSGIDSFAGYMPDRSDVHQAISRRTAPDNVNAYLCGPRMTPDSGMIDIAPTSIVSVIYCSIDPSQADEAFEFQREQRNKKSPD